MADMEVGNETAIKEFILLGFGNLPELQSCLFLLFLLIYIMTMVGNILILVLVVADQHLHTPMYFFLGILSCLEACYISTVLPRLLASLLSAVVQLACSETNLIELVAFCFASIDIFPPFLLTLMSYIYIITTIVSIPSTTGKRRAFSTCSSHLMVVTTFYGTLIMVYVIPRTNTLRDLNKVFSVFYTVLTPLVNPLIYSLRNKEFKEAFRKSVNRLVAFARSR
ncbi:olfactory receptor 11L1-like [Pelodiscus sinensis]|uniref:olfactory receptor 11L1-like n=1 Tax=Pelodiscus sinensis TaxID=13735 RepID=UPI003F6AC493